MRFSLFSASILLSGCLDTIEDPSLETFAVVPAAEAVDFTTEGTVTVAAGAAAGDWDLTVDGVTWSYHSPSRADLSVLDGAEVALKTTEPQSEVPEYFVVDDGQPRLLASSSPGEDGSSFFGRSIWRTGERIAKGVVKNRYDEENDVVFVEVIATDDDGTEHVLLPGEQAVLTVDGQRWQFTVISAYEAQNPPGMKCDTPDMLAIELFRTDVEASEPLVRPDDAVAPVGMCG